MRNLDRDKPFSIFRYNFNEMIEEENFKPYIIAIFCNSCFNDSQFGCQQVYRVEKTEPFICMCNAISTFSNIILPVKFFNDVEEEEIFSRKMNSWLSFWRWMLFL
jgi:hypothetical protein